MRIIDADAVKLDYSGLAYIGPYDFLGIADYFAQQIREQPTLTPQNEWVSVEERLPEKSEEYIVCACDDGAPIDERIWGDTVVVCADYYDGTFMWYEGSTEYDLSGIVTHWMPLPAPPKESAT